MTPIFADTSYFLALLGPADQYHPQAIAWSRAAARPLLTTEYIILEVGNSLIRGADRSLFVEFFARLAPTRERKSSRPRPSGWMRAWTCSPPAPIRHGRSPIASLSPS